ncbi:MAG: ATP-binding protein [Oscillospiraceae bacterium]|nr:ATP-binding protein [Oscillospiraceae bacterium]
MDGKLLALARREKENIRRQSVQEDRRRHQIAYARVPELRQLDDAIAGLMGSAVSAALGEGTDLTRARQESLDLQARRAELLVENGWPIDWLDGAWACPKCRDTGYVQGQICSCLTALYEQERAKDLSTLLKLGGETFGSFDLNYYDSAPDPATGISPRQQMETVFGICYDYALHFGKNSMNLLFQGSTGLGKTFLSACIAREVSQRGFSVVYETAVAALGAYERERFSRGEGEAEEAASQTRRLTGCDLLILDDLGTELVTEFSKSALYTLINARLLAGKKTVISTNLTPAQIERRYTPQIVSRLEGEYQTLLFVGTDIRRLKKERGLD